MKRLFVLFLFLPFYSSACDCNPPPIALEFLMSKYVFWGSVIEKEYAEDSLTYEVTFKIEKHFKENKANPSILKFTKKAEGEFTGNYTSCDYSVHKSEKWLVYAYTHQGNLVFSYYCSNSKPYTAFHDISRVQLNILNAGHDIDINKIVFERMAIGNLAYSEEYQRPLPKSPVDSLLARLKLDNYKNISDSHFENFVLNIDSKGNISKIAVPRKGGKGISNLEIKRAYDIRYPDYTPDDSLNTELQEDIIRNLKKGKWSPARFMGTPVNSQVHIQVYFRANRKPYSSPPQ